jgi:galacturan 1,4-alpha-galacturonidase
MALIHVSVIRDATHSLTKPGNSRDVLFENWDVTNGDDCIAVKGNSTNITIRNATCRHGNGMTIGSVGEYPDWPDYVENVLFEDVKLYGTEDGAYIKIWQGEPSRDSDNGAGGGGGAGYVKNVTFRNFELEDVPLPIQISQCIYTEGSGKCDSSKMYVSDITWENFKGTSRYNIAASIHCVKTHPCPNLYFKDVEIKSVNETRGLPLTNTDLDFEVFQCANIVNQNTTSNIPCNHYAPNNFGQHVGGNIKSSDYTPGSAGMLSKTLGDVLQAVVQLPQSMLRTFI